MTLLANTWTLSVQAFAPGLATQPDNQSKQTTEATVSPPTATKAVVESTVPVSTAGAVTLPIKTTPEVEIVKTCTTDRAYLAPALVDLSVAHDGVTTVVNQPFTYDVTARSVQAIRDAMVNCPVRANVAGKFHAITARQVDWRYSFAQTNGQCTLQEVRIGLNISQLLPAFTPEVNTPQNVIDAWDSYHNNLITHENGHITLAKQYVAELNAKLNSLGTMSCDTLKTQAKTLIDDEVNALNAADTSYDATTNHGATQGAVL